MGEINTAASYVSRSNQGVFKQIEKKRDREMEGELEVDVKVVEIMVNRRDARAGFN